MKMAIVLIGWLMVAMFLMRNAFAWNDFNTNIRRLIKDTVGVLVRIAKGQWRLFRVLILQNMTTEEFHSDKDNVTVASQVAGILIYIAGLFFLGVYSLVWAIGAE